MINECVQAATMAMLAYQAGNPITDVDESLRVAVMSYPMIEISIEQERLIDSFGVIYCCGLIEEEKQPKDVCKSDYLDYSYRVSDN